MSIVLNDVSYTITSAQLKEAKAYMPRFLSDAVPHSRIHRKGYYLWLQSFISMTTIKSDKDLQDALKMAKLKLQNSTFPGYVMLPAHEAGS